MYIITFYSFRGGLGRTTTLVNVGFELARRGRKVLLVDFDLEAPDLTNFPPLVPPEPHPGIVEYVAAYRESGLSPDITEYLYPVETQGQKGRLWVMPAGRGGPDYWEALAGIDWEGLYERQDGYLFFEDTRATWEQLGPDYVLIDAHAGITPALGICTRQLADAVVMMFNPRHGGGDGFHEVSWRIGKEAEQTGRKPIKEFFVAAGVAEADEAVPSDYEEDELGIIIDFAATVPFSHRLLLGKRAIEDQAGSRLAQAYRRLTNALIKANIAQDRDGARVVLCEIHARPGSASGIGGGLKQAHDFEKLNQIIDNFANDADVQAQAACCLYAAGRYDRALYCLSRAIELRSDSPELLWQRASYRSRVGGMEQPAVQDLLDLLEVSTRPREALSAEASLETLAQGSLQPPGTLFPYRQRPRFALPEGFAEEPVVPIALPDYADPLIQVSGVDRYVASALRKLRQLDAEKYEQAKKNPYITRLPVEIQRRLFAERLPDQDDADVYSLVRSRQWVRLVDLLRPRVEGSEWWTLEDAVLLFLAWWGLGKEAELQTCGKRAAERFHQQLALAAPEGEGLGFPELQIMAVVFWKTGEGDYARKILDAIDAQPEGQRIPSYWQGCTTVVWKRFKEDCDLIRQLFNGATGIRPPFLGKEPA